MPTDDDLIEQISRGDWAVEPEIPELAGLTRAVTVRRRRRHASMAAAGLAVAGTVALGGSVIGQSSRADLEPRSPGTGPANSQGPPSCSSVRLSQDKLADTAAVSATNRSDRTCAYRPLPLQVMAVEGTVVVDVDSRKVPQQVVLSPRGQLRLTVVPGQDCATSNQDYQHVAFVDPPANSYRAEMTVARFTDLDCAAPPTVIRAEVVPEPR